MMKQIYERIYAVFEPAAIAAWIGELLPKLITATIIFLIFWLLWKILERGLAVIKRRTKIDPTIFSFTHTAGRYVLFTIALLMALGELGINTTSLLTSLGIAGLTIGFAAKDTLSNVISGLFIFLDRPFVLDDLIEVDGHYGRVDKITLRSTRVVTPDGKMLAIPNSTIVNSTVASYTNFPHLRLDISLTIGVTEDLGKVRRLFLQLVEDDERFLKEPPAEMHVRAINDYNVEVELRVWLRDEKTHVAERFGLRERIFEAMRSAGVDMPFETIQLAPVVLGDPRTRAAA